MLVGDTIGNYRILGKIGEGGMGAVYVAEHALIGRTAAIKVLLREMSHRQDLVTRFFNEARAATAVKHPGIVEIYDFGYHHDGSAYIVMEYLEGESLLARLKRVGTLPEGRAAALCRQVAGALGAAHSKGIVHRDLKPDNIFIVRDPDIADGERTKILDFGIAKLATGEPGAQSMTRTGVVMGTPAYMSPEQCKGAGHVDARADLYALGCILFEMVCGRPPFVAEGAGEVMAQHIYAPAPAPSSIRPVTPALEQLLVRSLAKEAAHRFQSADEMIAALQVAVPTGSFPRAGGAMLPTVAMGAHGGMPTPPPYLPTPAPAAEKTTLSQASGATATGSMLSPPKKRGWVIPAVAVAVIGGGAVAIIAASGGGQGKKDTAAAAPTTPIAAPAPAPAPAPKPAPAPAPAPAPPAPTPPPAPARVTIHLDSDPAGADVYRMPQAVRIGTTPLDYPMDAIAGEMVVIVKKRGFTDQQLAVPADKDSAQKITLARAVVPTRPHGKGSGSQTDTPPPNGGTLDPFEKLDPKKAGGH